MGGDSDEGVVTVVRRYRGPVRRRVDYYSEEGAPEVPGSKNSDGDGFPRQTPTADGIRVDTTGPEVRRERRRSGKRGHWSKLGR